MPTEPSLIVNRDAGLVTARVVGCGELCAAQASRLSPRLAELASSLRGERVVLDLGGVGYAGSRGLTALAGLSRAANGRLTVVGANPLVRQAIEATRLDRVIDCRS